ncbi:MAG: hypothetical protein QOI86_3993 [Actinomycetota bacterium]|nr:hypothetical protein [Actinomycetota bacterium]
MRIALNGNRLVLKADLAAIREHAVDAGREGFAGYWLANHPLGSFDTITALASIAADVPGIELGTCVIPTWPRHPIVMAAQASTLQRVSGGRFTLGIGLSHPALMQRLGIDTSEPMAHATEYVELLRRLLDGRDVDYTGNLYEYHASLARLGDLRPQVLLAAMGPKMLALAGRVADGTIVTWTGPGGIRDHVRPRLDEAAARAGREPLRLAAVVSVAVCDDVEAARAAVDGWFEAHGQAPSYTANFSREGAEHPYEVQAIGDESQVNERLEEFAAAGVTDLIVGEASPNEEDALRTRLFLRERIAAGAYI